MFEPISESEVVGYFKLLKNFTLRGKGTRRSRLISLIFTPDLMLVDIYDSLWERYQKKKTNAPYNHIISTIV